MNELVSIIVPVYNAEKYIGDTIESVFNQTYSNWELILVDDGSSDNSLNICLSYKKKDLRVNTIHISNGGVSKARNTGIGLIHGKWFMFLDSDDILKPDAIETAIRNALKSDIVIFGFETFPQKQKLCVSKQRFYPEVQDMSKEFVELYRASVFNSPCNKLYKSKEKMELFDEDLSMGEDLLFNLKYFKNCVGIMVIPEVLYSYRRDIPESLSHRCNRDSMNVQVRLKNEIDASFNNNPNVVCETQKIFIRTMVDKMYSVLYSESISKDEKKGIIVEWSKESLLFCGGDNIKDIGVINKVFLFFVKKRWLWMVSTMGYLRKKVSKFIHRIQ